MEMESTGTSKGDWIFFEELEKTANYLGNQKKVLGFNPFCHSVELTETENVYKWHFRVTDPQNNPFDVIFYVEQTDELLVELPVHLEDHTPEQLTEEMILEHTVGRRIRWKHYPAPSKVEDPINYLFEGRASASLDLHRMEEKRTRVNFQLQVDVKFILYPAFRIIPEQIIKLMTNAGMSIIMQTATNRMFNAISKDFARIQHI